jgi:hypothetical protein
MSQLVRELDIGIGGEADHRISVGIVFVQFNPDHDGLPLREGTGPPGP